MQAVISFLTRFISIESVCVLLAKLIAKLLKYASLKGGDKWDKSKGILAKAEVWIHLFNQVYDDDNMSPEEEELVAKAIEEQTSIDKIVEILKK